MGGMEIINQTYYLKIKMGIKRAFPGTKLKDINKNLRASIFFFSIFQKTFLEKKFEKNFFSPFLL